MAKIKMIYKWILILVKRERKISTLILFIGVMESILSCGWAFAQQQGELGCWRFEREVIYTSRTQSGGKGESVAEKYGWLYFKKRSDCINKLMEYRNKPTEYYPNSWIHYSREYKVLSDCIPCESKNKSQDGKHKSSQSNSKGNRIQTEKDQRLSGNPYAHPYPIPRGEVKDKSFWIARGLQAFNRSLQRSIQRNNMKKQEKLIVRRKIMGRQSDEDLSSEEIFSSGDDGIDDANGKTVIFNEDLKDYVGQIEVLQDGTKILSIDSDGDGEADTKVTVPPAGPPEYSPLHGNGEADEDVHDYIHRFINETEQSTDFVSDAIAMLSGSISTADKIAEILNDSNPAMNPGEALMDLQATSSALKILETQFKNVGTAARIARVIEDPANFEHRKELVVDSWSRIGGAALPPYSQVATFASAYVDLPRDALGAGIGALMKTMEGEGVERDALTKPVVDFLGAFIPGGKIMIDSLHQAKEEGHLTHEELCDRYGILEGTWRTIKYWGFKYLVTPTK